MILVQDIGMSGYIPIEGAVVLHRFLLDYDLVVFSKEFNYLENLDCRKRSNLNVLNSVIFFAVFKRFDDSARSIIIRDIGLLSGYYRAGVVIPIKLLHIFKSVLDLKNYLNLGYFNLDYFSYLPSQGFARSAYITDWAEYICVDFWSGYICVDFIESERLNSYFLIKMLGVFEIPLPTFRCDELRYILG